MWHRSGSPSSEICPPVYQMRHAGLPSLVWVAWVNLVNNLTKKKMAHDRDGNELETRPTAWEKANAWLAGLWHSYSYVNGYNPYKSFLYSCSAIYSVLSKFKYFNSNFLVMVKETLYRLKFRHLKRVWSCYKTRPPNITRMSGSWGSWSVCLARIFQMMEPFSFCM